MEPLMVILGPTAVGKTEFAITLAQQIDGEIISADSMQIYKKMNIGTAKPTEEEMKLIPHHLVDCIMPDQEFTVADFQQRVDQIIPEISRKNFIPMLVGGTGLYIQALTAGFLFPEMKTDWELREKLHHLAKERGNESVHAQLKQVDPELADKLHPNDLRRVIRGIEVYQQTGKRSSYFHQLAKKQPERYNTIKIGLQRPREELYQRINLRVDLMIEQGLVEEVEQLLEEGYSPNLVSMQGLGYKEIVGYLRGDYDLTRAIYLLKRNTRHFAKRQLTWFNRDDSVIWFNLTELSTYQMVKYTKELIAKKW